MSQEILFATEKGLVVARFEAGAYDIVSRKLTETSLTCLARSGTAIVAGTRAGIQRSIDGGQSWAGPAAGPSIQHIRWLLAHPDRDDVFFAGTEPAGIFVSSDSGRTWTGRPEVGELRENKRWWLPYSPESGCVRGFAFHGERGYAAVEVGGLLRTDDWGRTWSLAPGSDGDPQFRTPPQGHIHADVHSVEVHPSSPDLVFAATNAGLYRSIDGGETWDLINSDGYTRAVWLDSDNPAHIISGPAAGVGRDGTVVETRDGGSSWRPLTEGLETPWPSTMVERFYGLQAGPIMAVLDDGSLRTFDSGAGSWTAGPQMEGAVRAIA